LWTACFGPVVRQITKWISADHIAQMEKISWTDHVRNEEVLLGVKEQRNILHEISKLKANWIGHILCRNWLLWQVIEGKIKGGIEVTGRWGRRCRKLLDDLKEMRGYSNLKEEALNHTMWRAGFGRDFGPVVRQTDRQLNDVNETQTRRISLQCLIKKLEYKIFQYNYMRNYCTGLAV
jgi:hypothetical protein